MCGGVPESRRSGERMLAQGERVRVVRETYPMVAYWTRA